MTEAADNTTPPILVAIDFSEDSKAALAWACNHAECTGASLVLLHVVHDLASHPGFYRPTKPVSLQPMQEVAESMMDEFINQLQVEHPEWPALNTAELQFVPGLPPSRIVEVAGLLNVSLIVMGARGFTGLPHKMLGAVAERVAELSFIPVVLVKSETHGVFGKKEIKRKEKRQKKERKKLKEILGLSSGPKELADAGE